MPPTNINRFPNLEVLSVKDRKEVCTTQSRPKQEPQCAGCGTKTRFITSILDVSRDRFVMIFRCDNCRKEVWE